MYYLLDWKAKSDNTDYSNTESSPDLDIPWTMGIYYPDILPEPIRCKLSQNRGDKLRDVYLIDLPIFSDEFILLLENSGVDNLQLYQAELIDKEGKIYKNYKAVNIVGLVSCTDVEASEYIPGSEPPLMLFSKLVIDESKIHGMKLFRLAEDSSRILIREDLKEEIEQANLKGFTLIPVESS